MNAQLGWSLVVVGVIGLAGYEGGPKDLNGPLLARLVGSEEVTIPPANCNTNGTQDTQCQAVPDRMCLETRKKCLPANTGILQTKICDPETGTTLRCNITNCIAANDDTTKDTCTPFTP